jgi:hypothetical protein
MRCSWSIIAVTLILASGGMLAATYPAAPAAVVSGPAAGVVQPGGPVDRLVTPRSAQAAAGKQTVVSSSNWAGYAATGTTGAFTSVESDWVQPAGHCRSGDQYAAFWVGLDGYPSTTVEQAGSEVDCIGGTAEYYAWYEMYPGASANFSDTVKPGDQLHGSVSYVGGNEFQITLTDSTEGWSQTLTQTLAGAARSSAEVIAEAPCCTSNGGILPLTNFGSVSFTGATVNSACPCKFNPVEIIMPGVTVSPIANWEDVTVSYTGAGIRPS